VNDVSREFGGALGIATIGSLVAALYRSNIEAIMPAGLPAELTALVAEGIGVAAVVASGLPAEMASLVMDTANTAFMQSMTEGFVISAIIMTSAIGIAFTLIPTRMRSTQAAFDESGFEPTGDDAPGLEGRPTRSLEPGPTRSLELGPTRSLEPGPVPELVAVPLGSDRS